MVLSKFLVYVFVWILCSGSPACTYVSRSVILHSILTWTYIARRKIVGINQMHLYISLIMLWLLLLSESCCSSSVQNLILAMSLISAILSFYIFYISLIPATCTLCLIIFQIRCHSYVKRVPHWLPIILVIFQTRSSWRHWNRRTYN